MNKKPKPEYKLYRNTLVVHYYSNDGSEPVTEEYRFRNNFNIRSAIIVLARAGNLDQVKIRQSVNCHHVFLVDVFHVNQDIYEVTHRLLMCMEETDNTINYLTYHNRMEDIANAIMEKETLSDDMEKETLSDEEKKRIVEMQCHPRANDPWTRILYRYPAIIGDVRGFYTDVYDALNARLKECLDDEVREGIALVLLDVLPTTNDSEMVDYLSEITDHDVACTVQSMRFATTCTLVTQATDDVIKTIEREFPNVVESVATLYGKESTNTSNHIH